VRAFGPGLHGRLPVLRYEAAAGTRALTCTAGALRRGLAQLPPGDLVALVPDGAEPPDRPAVTLVPVTDAVKRVRDGLLVETVDRTRLRFVVGPAVVRRATLEALAAAAVGDDDIVFPLAAEVIAR
jgi:hypothetical protein